MVEGSSRPAHTSAHNLLYTNITLHTHTLHAYLLGAEHHGPVAPGDSEADGVYGVAKAAVLVLDSAEREEDVQGRDNTADGHENEVVLSPLKRAEKIDYLLLDVRSGKREEARG